LEEITNTPKQRFGELCGILLLKNLRNIEDGPFWNVTTHVVYVRGASPNYFHRVRNPLITPMLAGCVLGIWLGAVLPMPH